MRSDCNIADIIIDAATTSTRSENLKGSSTSFFPKDSQPPAAPTPVKITLSQLRAARAQSPSFALQVVAFMCRSLLQQRRELGSLYLELFLSFLSGSLMGATSGGASIFTGVLIEPFSLMSPAPALFSLPLLSFFIGLTIGVSASPPAVRVFGNEKVLVRSEGAAGCSRSAYYVGKSLSVLPRLTLCAFHFSSIFYLLMAPRASFSSVFAAIWALNYCVYGLAAFLSVLSREGNSALLAVIVSMALAALCGYSPSLTDASSWGASILWDLQYINASQPSVLFVMLMQVHALGCRGVLLQRSSAVGWCVQHQTGFHFERCGLHLRQALTMLRLAALRGVWLYSQPMGHGHLLSFCYWYRLQNGSAAHPPLALSFCLVNVLQPQKIKKIAQIDGGESKS